MNTSPQPRLDAVLRQASERIEVADARPLLAHALGKPVSWLFAHGDETIEISALQRFRVLLEARESGRPVAYLTGRRGFWTLDLAVTADTLIPRPETELLVELAIARLPVSSPSRAADLGTGSGAIALAIAKERPECRVIATDASEGALDIAIGNGEGNGIRNVEFRMGSWFSPLMGERFDLIASNPPYIAEGDPHLDEGDLRFEPAAALSSGADGLDAIREIVSGAGTHLVAGAWLLLEHGLEQGAAIRELFEAAGFVDVATERDLESRDRVTLGRSPG
ncbi:peptide chain release factor N(5)-glutamine methyltransferase [Pseudoxanthomonas sacheonensis]|uniref:Release factor glutamine methyltransferase n=1 Tax=Pseudoxanthomonas sacheonensis TaxID=443615 RepID=A0ABU1RW13_9GAMM|nr:release factor glutamine methyltransferase [Pseudoxanthomonas sacheonensis]